MFGHLGIRRESCESSYERTVLRGPSRMRGRNPTCASRPRTQPVVDRETTMGFLRPRYLTLAAADLAGAVTAVVILVPSVKFAYRSESSHIMLETATAMIAVVAALLVYG